MIWPPPPPPEDIQKCLETVVIVTAMCGECATGIYGVRAVMLINVLRYREEPPPSTKKYPVQNVKWWGLETNPKLEGREAVERRLYLLQGDRSVGLI